MNAKYALATVAFAVTFGAVANGLNNGRLVAEEAASSLRDGKTCTGTTKITSQFGNQLSYDISKCDIEPKTSVNGTTCAHVSYKAPNWTGDAKAYGCVNPGR